MKKPKKRKRGESKIADKIDTAEDTGKKRPFYFKLIGIGLFFLIDFNINTIDILPDLIGFAFIFAGIGKTSYINENLLKAKNYINYCFIISGLKLVWNALYLIFGPAMFEAKILEDNLISLLSLAFAVTELIFCICIFMNIIKGIVIFFESLPGEGREKKPEPALLLLKIFFALKFILAVSVLVPELLTDINLDDLSVFFGLYLNKLIIKNILVPPLFIIQSLIGIFIFSVSAPFFFSADKDQKLYEFIKSKISGALLNDNFYTVNNYLKTAFAFFTAGCVFFADFLMDNINILPDFAVCVFFMAGISFILKIFPGLKNKKLGLYLFINFFISVFAYILNTTYKFTAIKSFTDENINLLQILKISSDLLFHSSVILFFLIFIEFYSFIRAFQLKSLEFSERYLNKNFTINEKNIDKNKNRIITAAAFAFCVKTAAAVLPQSGIVIFYHSAILAAFLVFIIRGLYLIKESVYSYYSGKN